RARRRARGRRHGRRRRRVRSEARGRVQRGHRPPVNGWEDRGMKAIVYTRTGDSDVLRLTDRPVPEPGPGEVRVRVAVSGVNPTDWKSRRRDGPTPYPELVPNQDGAGVVDAVGPDVPAARVGERVWLWEAAWQRADGTAQQYVVLSAAQAVPLP